eukprot:672371-Prymnesium_polylepis.1
MHEKPEITRGDFIDIVRCRVCLWRGGAGAGRTAFLRVWPTDKCAYVEIPPPHAHRPTTRRVYGVSTGGAPGGCAGETHARGDRDALPQNTRSALRGRGASNLQRCENVGLLAALVVMVVCV